MAIQYPWTLLKKGEGFFIPSLNLEKTKELGLRASVRHRIKASAQFGIKDGRLGVWFIRDFPRLSYSSQTDSTVVDGLHQFDPSVDASLVEKDLPAHE